MNVSRETERRLMQFSELATMWNSKINLVSPSTIGDFRTRHIDDSAQILGFSEKVRGHWVDLGSGGGLPGIVIAILAAEWDLNVTLVESDQRKSAFLRTVIRELSLQKTSVLTERIEKVPPLGADFLSARALAPLTQLLGMVHRHMRPDGNAWLMKGRSWRQECDEARESWRFDLRVFSSRTDPEAAILNVTGVSNA